MVSSGSFITNHQENPMNPMFVVLFLFMMFPVTIVLFGFAHIRMSISPTEENAAPDQFVTTIFRWLATATLFGFWLFTYSAAVYFSDKPLISFFVTAALAIRSIPIAKQLFRFGSRFAENMIEIERAIH